ncbi:MAG: sulfur carrier protein ThiS [Gammaproteobacteria bacterium]
MSAIVFKLNGELTQKPKELNLNELANELNLFRKKFAIEMNGEIIPKSSHSATLIKDGDVIEIVHAVGGG